MHTRKIKHVTVCSRIRNHKISGHMRNYSQFWVTIGPDNTGHLYAVSEILSNKFCLSIKRQAKTLIMISHLKEMQKPIKRLYISQLNWNLNWKKKKKKKLNWTELQPLLMKNMRENISHSSHNTLLSCAQYIITVQLSYHLIAFSKFEEIGCAMA